MHYLVDGWNYIFADSVLSDSVDAAGVMSAVKKLCVFLGSFSRASGKDVTVVFDGREQAGEFPSRTRRHFGEVRVVFTDSGFSADDEILDMIEHSGAPNERVVVTGDRRLSGRARRLKAEVLSCSGFREYVGGVIRQRNAEDDMPPEKLYGISDVEARRWEEIFFGNTLGKPGAEKKRGP